MSQKRCKVLKTEAEKIEQGQCQQGRPISEDDMFPFNPPDLLLAALY
jgi:hypothetical protein